MKEIKNVKEFNEIIKSDKPVLIDFYADWCGPCQTLLPTVEKLATKYKDDFIIAKINVDKNPELSRQFKVRSIPALFFIKDGEVQEQIVGGQSEHILESKIQSYTVTA